MMMVKKLYKKLFTKIIYIKKKNFNCYYYPPSPPFSGSTSLSEIEIK